MGTCSSKTAASGWDQGDLDAASTKAVTDTHTFKQPLDASKTKQRPQQQQQQQQQLQLQLQQEQAGTGSLTEQLPDEVLCRVLASLPLTVLVQLSTASRRMHGLISRGDKVLQSVDLSEVPPPKLDAAVGWLLAHPHINTLHRCTVPLNHVSAPKLLSSALPSLQELVLFVAPKAQGPEPALQDLNFSALNRLTTLNLPLCRGALPKGQHLALPPTLQQLQLSAGGFSSVAAALDVPFLPNLQWLTLSVMDTANTKPLAKLAGLVALVQLRAGRFWSVPSELHAFLRLESLHVECYGRVTNGVIGNIEQPLSATANGLHNLPIRPALHLSLDICVLASCGGIAGDWGALGNLCALRLDNIYPQGQAFAVGALASLPRLARLHLGFEHVEGVAGVARLLRVTGLPLLAGLQELSVRSKGPELDLSLEPPPHLHTLLVAADGAVTLEVPSDTADVSPVGCGASPAASPDASFSHSSMDANPGGKSHRRLTSITELDVVVEPLSPDPCHTLRSIPTLGVLCGREPLILDPAVQAEASSKPKGRKAAKGTSSNGALPLQAWLLAKGMQAGALRLALRQLQLKGRATWLLARSNTEQSVLPTLQALR